MPHTASPANASPSPSSVFTQLLPRNGSVLVCAGDAAAQLRIRNGAGAGQQYPLAAGSTLLLCAGNRPLSLWGDDCSLHPIDSGICRLLAFHDHAMDVQRAVPADRRQSIVLPIDRDLRNADVARDWLMEHLVEKDPDVAQVASAWALCEPYQLVRFVLEHPGLGVQQLADRYGLSVAQFRRIGRKAFGRSLKEQLRLLRAGRVLHRYAETGETFTRLSSDFGFSSPSHFCSEIKSLLGRSPSSIYQSVHSL